MELWGGSATSVAMVVNRVVSELRGSLQTWPSRFLPSVIHHESDLLPEESCQIKCHQEGSEIQIRSHPKGHTELYQMPGYLLHL